MAIHDADLLNVLPYPAFSLVHTSEFEACAGAADASAILRVSAWSYVAPTRRRTSVSWRSAVRPVAQQKCCRD
ncbi:hypothetical protein BM536_005250 [Streptomyces phaeoluteigriseus]|uniref:Uncharacterized protein n=1 Tax=Streptomyces phaeoluteigriseus TaxID=114686 RepID=A0A1V6MY58_9ACTN|nr:hypothetical protein [Streptomyces phaeoluteigriseus]OQD57374.1 hypothetical protein BM536_005250 [Streptomyces phaeoluteigriseus]